ncbi:MAG: esterase/lipase superfamily enzyme [Paraglaciecola sp.]|jgi:esterase/lipase superfamily enzyme
MYTITNRKINKESGDLNIFSKEPNEKGPNELRLVKITKLGTKFKAEVINETSIPANKKKSIAKFYNIDPSDPILDAPSLYAAHDVFSDSAHNNRHVLLYVHGYNNDMDDVIKTAFKLEALYNVTVIPFSWPANGGGPLSGAASYKSDKRDARASTGAFDRFLEKVQGYHKLFVTAQKGKLMALVKVAHPDNHEQARAEYTRLQAKECKITLNLLCHSMGNYLLKYTTIPSSSMMRKLVFDNICMVSADTNNKNHKDWVGGMEARSGIYIVINQEDSALGWSRRKPGDEQLARLGHYLKDLDSTNADYLNVTSKHVGDDHSYFKDDPVKNDDKLKAMFAALFEGRKPESKMKPQSEIIRAYKLR